MVNKHEYTGKTYEEAVNKAKIDLQELEENLIINTKEEKKAKAKAKNKNTPPPHSENPTKNSIPENHIRRRK